MKKRPRVYTEEYKKQAIQLAQDMGSRTAAARQLGITDVNIFNWEKKLESGSGEVAALKADESAELKRLRKEMSNFPQSVPPDFLQCVPVDFPECVPPNFLG